MSIWIEKDEGTAGRRRVPCRIFLSDGTSPDTGALNDAVIMGTNSLATFSLNSTLRAVNANQGMYCVELTQSEVSVLGTHPLYHTVGDFPQHIATIQVVNNNPMSTLSAISDVTLAAKEYSNVTLRIGLVAYSGATVGAGNIAPGTYSGVSVEVKSGGIQTSSIGAGNYSGVSVEVKSGGIQTSSIGAGTYSSVTMQGVVRLDPVGERSLASSYLSTNLGANRFVQQAYEVLRNRVLISGSTMTVYQTDDATSSWTASVTTGAGAITQIDPGGA